MNAHSETTEIRLNKCDAALRAKINEAELCNLGVKLRDDELSRLSKENTQLRSRGTGLLDNPATWAAIGVIFGVWAGTRVVK